MIRRAWRRTVNVVGSPRFATGLLVFLGGWFAVSTFVPQTRESVQEVATWAAAHPVIEPVVRALGLHHAFTSIPFVLGVLALALSTALCAWRRTKVAARRMRMLREAAATDAQSLGARHDLEITPDPALRGPAVLSAASETLRRLGVGTKRRDDMLVGVSSPWSVWGSPVFHWALLALIVAVLAGALGRSEGLMGVAVGQTKPDVPESYGVLHSGPLRGWARTQRSIRVDAFDPKFRAGKIDRGPTPTVSVLDGEGRVIATQHVYPNNPLQAGSLTVHRNEYGLSATLVRSDASGVTTGRSVQLLDFSEEATGGTRPAGHLLLSDAAGNPQLKAFVTVPLDREGDYLMKRVPENPTARVVLTTVDDKPVLERVVSPGEGIPLPAGGSLLLENVGWYARLNVVHDQSIPLLYAAGVMALIGLTLVVVLRQYSVVAAVVEGPDGLKLIASVRLWRNVPTNRAEIESELARALGCSEKESES